MIIDLSTFLKRRIDEIPDPIKTAFISAFIVGLIAHIVFITSMIVNNDSLYTISQTTEEARVYSLGRWAAPFFGRISGIIASQSISGILGITILSVASCFTVATLSVKSRISAFVISCFIILFPSVFSYFLYLGGDTFSFSILFSSAAAYFTIKYRKGYIAGILLLTISLGIYQAYIGYTAGLFLINLIAGLLGTSMSVKKTLFATLKYLLVIIGSMILYYIILQIFLSVTETSLATYRGISQVGQFSLRDLPQMIYFTLGGVWSFMINDAYGAGTSIFIWIYRIFVLLNISLVILLLIKNAVYQNKARLLLLITLIILLLFAVHLIQLINYREPTHLLMVFPFVILFISVILFSELLLRDTANNGNTWLAVSRILNWIAITVSIVLVFNWWILANQAYKLMQYSYESSLSLASNISGDIRRTQGFTSNTPVYIVMEGRYVQDVPELSGFSHINTTGVVKGNLFIDAYFERRLEIFIGIHLNEQFRIVTDPDVRKNIKNSPEFLMMPSYPDYGYVQMIDGVIVAKIVVRE